MMVMLRQNREKNAMVVEVFGSGSENGDGRNAN